MQIGVGAIAGIIIGAVIFIAITIAAVVYIKKKRSALQSRQFIRNKIQRATASPEVESTTAASHVRSAEPHMGQMNTAEKQQPALVWAKARPTTLSDAAVPMGDLVTPDDD